MKILSMHRSILPLFLVLVVSVFVGCAATHPFECGRLATLQLLPFHATEQIEDETHRYILSLEKHAREAALVRCIDDSTLMADPRKAPPYGGFVIGDLAVMLLSDSTGISFEELLPDEVKGKWDDQGVYAYFEYVFNDSNRAALKERWKERLSISEQ